MSIQFSHLITKGFMSQRLYYIVLSYMVEQTYVNTQPIRMAAWSQTPLTW